MALGGAASKAATSGSTVSTVVNGDGTLSLVGAAGAEGALEAFAATFQGVLTDFGVVKNIQNDWDSLMDAHDAKDEWHRMTAKESETAANELGFYKTNYRAKNGEPIYYNPKTKTYISQDIGSGNGMGPHNGGVWKQAKTPEALNSKKTRMGTYDANLNRIGD